MNADHLLLYDALNRGQTIRLRATSGSMRPTIEPGDLLLARQEPVEVGDIALVDSEPHWLTHRVVQMDGSSAWLQGDARGATVHRVAQKQILGRVIAVSRDVTSITSAIERKSRQLLGVLRVQSWRRLLGHAAGGATLALGRLYCGVDQRLLRAQRRARLLAKGFFAHALSSQEQSRLGVSAYNLSSNKDYRAALFHWEEPWLDRHLPAPPARILLGGAGAGREIAALLAKGYQVDGLEPTASAAQRAAELLASQGTIVVCSYEDLSAAMLEQRQNSATYFVGKHYDAVLLGWGSLTHVLDVDERRRLLAALSALTHGPILATCWLASARPRPKALAEKCGEALGRRVGAFRNVAGDATTTLSFGSWYGFGACLSWQELQGLAAPRRTLVREELAGMALLAWLPNRRAKPTGQPKTLK